MARTDAVLTHSTVEADLLGEALPEVPAYHFPLIHDPEPTPSEFDQRIGVGFIGGFGHPPNSDGVDWFLDAIWPLVRAQKPDTRFVLAGSKMPERYKALHGQDGIDVLGFVESLPGFFDQIKLSVAPLRFGAGAKGKVAASLAYGTPCVTTPIGAEGMGVQAGQDIEVAETAEDLAAQIVRLLDDEDHWKTRRDAGLAFAQNHTSRAVVRQRLQTMLDGFESKTGLAKSAE